MKLVATPVARLVIPQPKPGRKTLPPPERPITPTIEGLEARLLMTAQPTITIIETITAATDLNNQPITIASEPRLRHQTSSTIPGTYTVDFTMQASGLADGQNIANLAITPLPAPQPYN